MPVGHSRSTALRCAHFSLTQSISTFRDGVSANPKRVLSDTAVHAHSGQKIGFWIVFNLLAALETAFPMATNFSKAILSEELMTDFVEISYSLAERSFSSFCQELGAGRNFLKFYFVLSFQAYVPLYPFFVFRLKAEACPSSMAKFSIQGFFVASINI